MERSETNEPGPGGAVPRAVWVAAIVAAMAVHVVLWWLYYHPQPKVLWGDEQRYLEAARGLLSGDPGWRPELLWPSLYVRFVAGLTAVAGGSLVAVQLAQTALLVLAGVLVGDLGRRLSGSTVAGFVAGWLCVAFPPLVAFAHYLWPELLHLFLWMAALWLLSSDRSGGPWMVVAGLCLGLALLTKSLLTPFLPVVVVAVVVTGGGRARLWRAVGRAALVSVTAVLVVAPTVLSNWRAEGLPIIADSSAFNLWVGLNDRGRKAFSDEIVYRSYLAFSRSGSTFAERNRATRERVRRWFEHRTIADTLAGQAGRQYFRLLDKDSYLTEQLPGGAAFAQGRGYRAPHRLLATGLRWSAWVLYAAVLGLAPTGYLLWRFRSPVWVVVLLLFVAYNLVLFFWLHATPRYRVQLLPVLFLGCGAAVAWLQARRTVSGVRVAAAVVAALLLLFFGFAGPLL
jgi:4-amino-4-deoxy-L-arabinose transferase-like glycosyltransferase